MPQSRKGTDMCIHACFPWHQTEVCCQLQGLAALPLCKELKIPIMYEIQTNPCPC